jgi:hypothetical protein
MGDWPDTAGDTPGSAASTRPLGTGKDAIWDSCAASQSNDISLIIAGKPAIAGTFCCDGSTSDQSADAFMASAICAIVSKPAPALELRAPEGRFAS